MIRKKKIKQHTYLWSDAEWWFCYYQVVTYVQVSSIHIALSISKLIFGENDRRSISESQNFSCLSERSWPELQEIRSNVCCDMSAATSQLPDNALCHANLGGSTADAGSTLWSLPLPCPWNSTHPSWGSCVTLPPLSPSQGRVPALPRAGDRAEHTSLLYTCFSLQPLVQQHQTRAPCHHPLAACS